MRITKTPLNFRTRPSGHFWPSNADHQIRLDQSGRLKSHRPAPKEGYGESGRLPCRTSTPCTHLKPHPKPAFFHNRPTPLLPEINAAPIPPEDAKALSDLCRSTHAPTRLGIFCRRTPLDSAAAQVPSAPVDVVHGEHRAHQLLDQMP